MRTRVDQALYSLLAGALPLVVAEIWPGPASAKPIAAYVFFLCIAVVARFFGVAPALVCTVTSTLMLYVAAQQPPTLQIARLGTFVIAALVIIGVSHQKSIEASREVSTRRLYGLFDSFDEGIFFFDSSGRCLEVNPAAAKLVGVARQTLIGTRIGELTGSPDPATTAAFLAQLEEERLVRGRFVLQRKDGTVREVEYVAMADILSGVHGLVAHDVTEQIETERSFAQLSRRLLELQEQERRRIARELHDTTGQHLAALRLNLSRIVRAPQPPPALVEETFALIDQSAAEIRTLSYLLHPPMIEQAGLVAMLRWYVRGFEERSGIAVGLDADDDLGPLTPETATSLFRVVQEALTNIHRHSGSSAATVTLKRHDRALYLEVADEGRGLRRELIENIDALGAFGVGLAGMKERIEGLGGTLRIESGGEGTRLTATLPSGEPEDQIPSDGQFGTSRLIAG